jgi:hypothetical protein
MNYKLILSTLLAFTSFTGMVPLQEMPSVEENIPFLVTFSKQADKNWGDDDFVQTIFTVVPESRKDPVYIRIFDPDNGGKHDECRGTFNSKTKFTIYGGKGACSDPDARKTSPEGNFKSGVQLATHTFGKDTTWDDKWYTFGPFNPQEGELQPEYGGYVLKLIVEGLEGDDGNLYKVFISSKKNQNVPIEGGNAFAFEYCFRTNDKTGSVSHLYPFVGKNVVSVKINVFDYDNEGLIRIVSASRKGDFAIPSKDGAWSTTLFKISPQEINTSLDVQLIKKTDVINNNMVIYITDQYGESLPFYTLPIGGVPKFNYKIGVKPKGK